MLFGWLRRIHSFTDCLCRVGQKLILSHFGGCRHHFLPRALLLVGFLGLGFATRFHYGPLPYFQIRRNYGHSFTVKFGFALYDDLPFWALILLEEISRLLVFRITLKLLAKAF